MSLIRITLTPQQARDLWAIVDGAADAGACEDGLSKSEAKSARAFTKKLLQQHEKWNSAALAASREGAATEEG